MKAIINKLKNKFDSEFVRFLIVGTINTIFGTAIMFIFYNVFKLSYWLSSASNYFFGSILSYFLNKYFTFRSKNKSWKEVIRFALNITICYFIAYGLAQPLARRILESASKTVQDNVSMLIGMVLFVILNFLGQRIFVFKKGND